MSYKFYVVSDTHLEYQYCSKKEIDKLISYIFPGYILEHDIDPDYKNILLLCGDIGYPGTLSYRYFLEKCSSMFYNVFVIPGNHEYYDTNYSKLRYTNIHFPEKGSRLTMEDINTSIEKDCIFSGCKFLGNKVYVFEDVPLSIIGVTFWHNKNKKDNDSIFIKDFTVEKRIEKHKEDIMFLEDAISMLENKNIEVIIMTHHPITNLMNVEPETIRSIFPYNYNEGLKIGHKKEDYLEQDILDNNYKKISFSENNIFSHKNIFMTVSGHTHSSLKKIKNNIIFFSNCIGRPDELSYFNKNIFIKYVENI